ncbi:MAG: hypothetical protein MZV64_59295 [Ignavibacteriales bacterium]|nr:hypothetical protein [Ignavibacteriales bacterium]
MLIRLPKPCPRLCISFVQFDRFFESGLRQVPLFHQSQPAPDKNFLLRRSPCQRGQVQGGAKGLGGGIELRVQLGGGEQPGYSLVRVG